MVDKLIVCLLDIFIGVGDEYKLVIEDSLMVQFILLVCKCSCCFRN
jgi:hypothetical protein